MIANRTLDHLSDVFSAVIAKLKEETGHSMVISYGIIEEETGEIQQSLSASEGCSFEDLACFSTLTAASSKDVTLVN